MFLPHRLIFFFFLLIRPDETDDALEPAERRVFSESVMSQLQLVVKE